MSLFQTYMESGKQISSKLAQKILNYLNVFDEIKKEDYSEHANKIKDFIFDEENLSKMIYFILDKEAKFNKGTQLRILIEEQFKSLADKITKEVIK
jgi:hypothetical protein